MLEGLGENTMGYRVFLDSFSGDLAELKRGKRTPENALAVLNKSPMVSTWDMSENKWLYRLISDLKQRGMLDDTIVLWATEFGRTPTREGKNGRGHHRDCFSIWLAGGGFKPGHVHGRTDDIVLRWDGEWVYRHDPTLIAI